MDKGEYKFKKPAPQVEQEHNSEQIEKECREDLVEIASFYGGWDKLRKVINQLEENENERNFDNWMESRLDEPSAGERAEMAYKQKYS